MRIAAVQMVSRLGDTAGNVRHARELIGEAVTRGARLVLLPEYFQCGSVTETLRPETFALAEPIDGPSVSALAAEAARLRAWICAPLFERDGDRFFNCAVALDHDGRVAARYRKRFLPNRRANEKYLFTPGDLPSPVWEVDGVRFGVNICFERQFIETSRIPALKGADVLLHPSHTWSSGWAQPGDTWVAQATAMARLNSLWVLAACATHAPGKEGPGGRSLLADPRGAVAQVLGDEEGVLLADVDPQVARDTRERMRMLSEQRADVLEEMIAASAGVGAWEQAAARVG